MSRFSFLFSDVLVLIPERRHSICFGQPVLAHQLDGTVWSRASPQGSYVPVSSNQCHCKATARACLKATGSFPWLGLNHTKTITLPIVRSPLSLVL